MTFCTLARLTLSVNLDNGSMYLQYILHTVCSLYFILGNLHDISAPSKCVCMPTKHQSSTYTQCLLNKELNKSERASSDFFFR